jgi:hypothetical protein
MLLQDLPQCGVCNCLIVPPEPSLDYSTSGLGHVHDDNECDLKARELAYQSFAEAAGLEPVDGQCLHGVGEAWTNKQHEWHDHWDCKLQGIAGYQVFDHRRMWVVQEGSPWSSITEPGLKIMTSEPYIPEAQPIPSDSWLWYELGWEFLLFRFDDVALHLRTADGSPRTVLHVWARPRGGDTDEKRERRKDFRNRLRHLEPHE